MRVRAVRVGRDTEDSDSNNMDNSTMLKVLYHEAGAIFRVDHDSPGQRRGHFGRVVVELFATVLVTRLRGRSPYCS